VLDPLNPQPMDPVNALLGFVVSSLGQALLSGATRAILGTPVERALRGAFSSAIDTAADDLTDSPGQRGILRDALRRPRRELARPEAFADLPQLVGVWLDVVDEHTAPGWLAAQGVDRLRLAESLHAQICREVIANGLSGGPLQPLAEHTNFQRVFGLSQEILQQLRPVREMLEELLRVQRQQAGRDDQLDSVAEGARTLIDDRAATFTGRQYLCRQIDEIIGTPDFPSGYLLIVGEPGIGKTSLLAHLISERGYLYHFNNRRQGVTSVQAFLDSVCRQLASRYGLGSKLPPHSPPTSAVFSDLVRAAAQRAAPEAPLIIAVDALDESEPAPDGANRMLLPPVLPPNVYFLVTTRPLASYQLSVDRSRTLTITDDDPQNLQDIRSYIGRELAGPFRGDFSERIAAWQVTEHAFVDTLARKSQGSFMYIVHMLASIRQSRLTEEAMDDIEQLPVGLSNYYHTHWEVMKTRWPPALWRKHETAVRCLALMQNPVSPTMLIELAGKENLPGVDESLVLRVFADWREFLNEQWNRQYREKRYYIYHDTFREFLDYAGPSLAPLAQKIYKNQLVLLRQILDGS
jgi:AAA ATPase domain